MYSTTKPFLTLLGTVSTYLGETQVMVRNGLLMLITELDKIDGKSSLPIVEQAVISAEHAANLMLIYNDPG